LSYWGTTMLDVLPEMFAHWVRLSAGPRATAEDENRLALTLLAHIGRVSGRDMGTDVTAMFNLAPTIGHQHQKGGRSYLHARPAAGAGAGAGTGAHTTATATVTRRRKSATGQGKAAYDADTDSTTDSSDSSDSDSNSNSSLDMDSRHGLQAQLKHLEALANLDASSHRDEAFSVYQLLIPILMGGTVLLRRRHAEETLKAIRDNDDIRASKLYGLFASQDAAAPSEDTLAITLPPGFQWHLVADRIRKRFPRSDEASTLLLYGTAMAMGCIGPAAFADPSGAPSRTPPGLVRLCGRSLALLYAKYVDSSRETSALRSVPSRTALDTAPDTARKTAGSGMR
jgi:hypothetical protein